MRDGLEELKENRLIADLDELSDSKYSFSMAGKTFDLIPITIEFIKESDDLRAMIIKKSKSSSTTEEVEDLLELYFKYFKLACPDFTKSDLKGMNVKQIERLCYIVTAFLNNADMDNLDFHLLEKKKMKIREPQNK